MHLALMASLLYSLVTLIHADRADSGPSLYTLDNNGISSRISPREATVYCRSQATTPFLDICGKNEQLRKNLQQAIERRCVAEQELKRVRTSRSGRKAKRPPSVSLKKKNVNDAIKAELDASKACIDSSPKEKAAAGNFLRQLEKAFDKELNKTPEQSIFRPLSAAPKANPRKDLGVIGALADELVPGKSYRDLFRSITSDEPVSLGTWLEVMWDVVAETASYVPTPAAPLLQAMKVGRAVIRLKNAAKLVRAVQSGAKKLDSANTDLFRVEDLVGSLESVLGACTNDTQDGPGKKIFQLVDLIKAAEQIKLPRQEVGGALSPSDLSNALSQVSQSQGGGNGTAAALKQAVEGMKSNKGQIPKSNTRRAPQPAAPTNLGNDISKVADFRDKNQPLPLELITDILPMLETQLLRAAGQENATDDAPLLDNNQFIEQLADAFRRI